MQAIISSFFSWITNQTIYICDRNWL